MACPHCELKGERIIEDDAVAVVEDSPIAEGHVLVLPRQHYPIMEQVPDEIVANMFLTAAKVSAAVFDAVKATGTNIILQNGIAAGQKVPHTAINVIPRKEGDGLNFQWRATQLPDSQMSDIAVKLQEQLAQAALPPELEAQVMEETPARKPAEAAGKAKPEKLSEKENYLIKQLEKVP